MWKNILLKDFKFTPNEPLVLGRSSETTGPYVNLSAKYLKGKSEEEMIDMIVATLAHESAHQAFSQVADTYGDGIYKIAIYFDDLYNEIMKQRKAIPLDEEKLNALVGETVGNAVIDELFAHEAGSYGGKGPEHLYFNAYHVGVSSEVGRAFDNILKIMDENKEHFKQLIDPKNKPSPEMRETYEYLLGLHNLLMTLFKKAMDRIVKEIEQKYKLVLITLINKKVVSKTLDLSNPKIKTLFDAVMTGNFEVLDDTIASTNAWGTCS